MIFGQEELDFVIRGLSLLEERYMGDYHIYREGDNQLAALDCLGYFTKVRNLRQVFESVRCKDKQVGYEIDTFGTDIA